MSPWARANSSSRMCPGWTRSKQPLVKTTRRPLRFSGPNRKIASSSVKAFECKGAPCRHRKEIGTTSGLSFYHERQAGAQEPAFHDEITKNRTRRRRNPSLRRRFLAGISQELSRENVSDSRGQLPPGNHHHREKGGRAARNCPSFPWACCQQESHGLSRRRIRRTEPASLCAGFAWTWAQPGPIYTPARGRLRGSTSDRVDAPRHG